MLTTAKPLGTDPGQACPEPPASINSYVLLMGMGRRRCGGGGRGRRRGDSHLSSGGGGEEVRPLTCSCSINPLHFIASSSASHGGKVPRRL